MSNEIDLLSKDHHVVSGERVCGAVVAVTSDHHQEEVDNFELVLDAARSSAASTSSGAGPAGLPPPMTGGAANGATDEGTAAASPQEEASGAVGPCVTTQNCQADQSATPLSPPVVSMATTHYTLDEDGLPGGLLAIKEFYLCVTYPFIYSFINVFVSFT